MTKEEMELMAKVALHEGALDAYRNTAEDLESTLKEVEADQNRPTELSPEDPWHPTKWTPAQAHAISSTIQGLLTKMMARLKELCPPVSEIVEDRS